MPLFKNLYVGFDKESFWDFHIHIGNIRVEWNGPLHLPSGGPAPFTRHRRKDRKDSQCL